MVLLLLTLLTGCGHDAPVVFPSVSTPAQAEATVPPAFRNAAGELACPVMGDVIATPADAVSHLDHDGLRYYFCCESCEVAFRDDPEKYARGAFLAAGGEGGARAAADGETCGE